MDQFINQPMEQHKSKGWLVTVIVVVLVALAFLIYFLRGNNLGGLPGLSQSDVQKLQQQGSSDNVASIDADLKATDLTNLDKETTDINKELSAPVTQ